MKVLVTGNISQNGWFLEKYISFNLVQAGINILENFEKQFDNETNSFSGIQKNQFSLKFVLPL